MRVLQVRAQGMLETVRVRKAGYALRLPFEEFVSRYWSLARGNESVPGA